MDDDIIPFTRPYLTGKELHHIAEAQFKGKLSGDGPYTKLCHQWLENTIKCRKALLTHSCTAALEMAALLFDIQPGDEIIMPSYTFVSTANAFVLRGGIPVFVDIREDTMNLDEKRIEAAITPRTKAIVPVHYAGVACEMDTIMDIAKQHSLAVLEDAAQGLSSRYKGRPLGSIGDLAALSFHETKNVISGEGGALLVNTDKHIRRAEIIREKGTDRSRFLRGEVDKYTWQSVGSSFLPGELTAAFLWAQMQDAEEINAIRLAVWDRYHALLEPLESKGLLRRQIIPLHCEHNAHMYFVLLSPEYDRGNVLEYMRTHGIQAVFHYVPLHSAPAGLRYGRVDGSLSVTNDASSRLIRLPLFAELTEEMQERIVDVLGNALGRTLGS